MEARMSQVERSLAFIPKEARQMIDSATFVHTGSPICQSQCNMSQKKHKVWEGGLTQGICMVSFRLAANVVWSTFAGIHKNVQRRVALYYSDDNAHAFSTKEAFMVLYAQSESTQETHILQTFISLSEHRKPHTGNTVYLRI